MAGSAGAALIASGNRQGNDAFTMALLHLDGTDASTTITNSALAGTSTWSASGNAQIDTAQSKFGGASLLLDGAGDYISGSGGAELGFGTGDFTIDCWVRFNSVAGVQIVADWRANGSGTTQIAPTIYINGAVVILLVNGGNRITGTTSLSTGVWYHVMLSRTGTSTRLFLDGAQEGSTYVDSNNYITPTLRPTFGISGHDGATGPLNGWLDEIRISNGIARETSSFTPPTVPYY